MDLYNPSRYFTIWVWYAFMQVYKSEMRMCVSVNSVSAQQMGCYLPNYAQNKSLDPCKRMTLSCSPRLDEWIKPVYKA